LPWIDHALSHVPNSGSQKQLRSFGLLVGGIFLLIGLWPVLRYGSDIRIWAVIPGVLLTVPALAAPMALREPYRIWMLLGYGLGWVNARIILTFVFFAVFTPVGLFMRMIARDALKRDFEPEADSYRVPKTARAPSHMKHQF
jgi:hypothetical protein